MSALLFAALVMVLSHQPILHIETIPGPVTVTISETASVKVEQELFGWAVCTTTEYQDGRRVGHVDRIVAVPASVKADTLEHEALHAVDCLDDGVVNGSPHQFNDQISPLVLDPAHAWVSWAQANPKQAIAIIGVAR